MTSIPNSQTPFTGGGYNNLVNDPSLPGVNPPPAAPPPLVIPIQLLGDASGLVQGLGLPQLNPPNNTGNLTTADLLQIIRKQVKQVSEQLQKAQEAVIRSQQSTIEAKSKATIEKLNEAIDKLNEAKEIKDAMGIFNKIMYGVMGVVLALLTPVMAIMPPLAVLAWGAFAAYITLNEKDNGKHMEDVMTKISEDWGVAWESEGIEKQKENGMISFTTVMAAIQIIIAIIATIATVGAALGPSAGVAASSTATSVALSASTAAATAASTAASTAATTAATTATTAATTAASTAASTASSSAVSALKVVANLVATIAQTAVTFTTASAKLAGAVYDYQGTNLKADAETLKAYVKYLQHMLQNDMDFLQQLTQIQAELDKGVSGIVRNEHDTNIKLSTVTQFS